MKKFLPLSLTVMLVLATVLSGCGSSSNGGGNSNGGGPSTPNPPPTPISITESLAPGETGLSVTYPYYMAQTEVTYQTWVTVRNWGTANGYNFACPGSRGGYFDMNTNTCKTYTSGHEDHPVTEITWRDAIVWCNALTEYYNTYHGTAYECAYKKLNGDPIRDASDGDACDNLTDDGHTAKGFRLPTGAEWYLAARYIDGTNWTPDDYASGATANYENTEATQAVAWYWDLDANVPTTQPVGQKIANALDIYDMSGNVSEFCFDLLDWDTRMIRGGDWGSSAADLQIDISNISNDPDRYNEKLGFRPVRTK